MLIRLKSPSLVTRIVLATAMIGAVVLSLAAAALTGNARSAIEREVNAGRGLARDYVVAAVGSLLRTNSPDQAVAFLPATLYQPRHVKIAVIDRVNGITHFPRPAGDRAEEAVAPAWFVRLLSPPPQELQLPIRSGTDSFGTVVITTAPEDEINEVWQDFRVLAGIGALTYLSTLVILSVVLKFALRPLSHIGAAFESLEDGDFETRIGSVSTPDFAPLAERFDRLAETVARALSEKDSLNRRLVAAQDEERKAVSMELHDEMGPCLFGLRVETRAIRDAARRSGDDALSRRAENLLHITKQIQATNRQLLERLRPIEIGQLPLSVLLEDLIDKLRTLNPEMHWDVEISDSFDGSLGEAEELHIYRILQEAATNSLRHSGAQKIFVRLKPDTKGGDALLLEIGDDGAGWSGKVGSGISGMRERARSLGGKVELLQNIEARTLVAATIPLV